MKKDLIKKKYSKSFKDTGKTRNHIILMDGTWNDETGKKGNGLVTNIVNLHRIFVNNEKTQIVRYHRGVGNDNDNGILNSIKDGITGSGVLNIVEKAYVRLVQDWEPNDKIYIFGFSRGAAAARLLASKINSIGGIPKELTIELIPKQNKELKSVEQILYRRSFNDGKSRDKHPMLWKEISINALCVWDTVSAFGLLNNIARAFGKKYDLFSNNTVSSNIKKAFHLVAIDETRNPFTPSLMNYEEGRTHEVWFPGVHSDIGGSYLENELAKCSLHYMLKLVDDFVEESGYPELEKNESHYEDLTLEFTKKAFFHFHGLGKLTFKSLRDIEVKEHKISKSDKQPKIHRLYYDLSSSNQCYSVVKRRKEKQVIKFQYMPYNIKQLETPLNIVE